jgi:hypothetical protein
MRSPAKAAAIVVAILSAGALLASFPVEASFERRSVLAQRVEVDEAAAGLFGEGPEYREIGSPQRVIVDEPGAFIDHEGRKLLNESYLREKRIYPLQLRTVSFTATLVRVSAAVLFLASLSALILLRRRRG